METVTVTSSVFPTAEQAAANISGAPLGMPKGKTAKMGKVDVVEVAGGFKAIGIVEISEDTVEAEEDKKEDTGTQSGSGDSGAEQPGADITLLPGRPSLAEETMLPAEQPALPETVPEPLVPPVEDMNYLHYPVEEPQPQQADMQTGPETLSEDADKLTEKLQSDFEEAEEVKSTPEEKDEYFVPLHDPHTPQQRAEIAAERHEKERIDQEEKLRMLRDQQEKLDAEMV